MNFRIGRSRGLALLCGAALWISTAAFAADGDLDLTFNGTGIVTTNNRVTEQANDLVIQPDGKIVVAGSGGLSSFFSGIALDFQVARYNPDGSLDATFGSGGIVTTNIGGNNSAEGVALQADGKIVIAGATNIMGQDELALVRFNSDGSIDTTFGAGGFVAPGINLGANPARDLVIQPDGKIVVAGSSNDFVNGRTFTVARFDASGGLDATFGSGGVFATPYSAPGVGGRTAEGVALQADGRIVVAGSGPNGDFVLVRYNTDGSLDTTFGIGGLTFTDISGNGLADFAHDVVIQPDGKIVAAGYTGSLAEGGPFAVARYNVDGSLDSTFGSGGITITPLVGDTRAYGMALGTGGTIVVAGKAQAILNVVRYDSSGFLDPTFGGTGIVTTPVGSSSGAFAVALQSDGRVVAAGVGNQTLAFPDFVSDFAVVRYEGTVSQTPAEKIASLIADINALVAGGDLAANKAAPLINKLEQVLAKLAGEQAAAACSQLSAFSNQVNAYVNSGTLTAAEGQALIDAVNAIRADLGC
ncbi:MAG TPA: delta-60 repeat domain-containing protein [Thermoanaerobaculia bacterium]|nr:delta-60 repeat domain-containing protein [Thermoanaerobaculia bacterium]